MGAHYIVTPENVDRLFPQDSVRYDYSIHGVNNFNCVPHAVIRARNPLTTDPDRWLFISQEAIPAVINHAANMTGPQKTRCAKEIFLKNAWRKCQPAFLATLRKVEKQLADFGPNRAIVSTKYLNYNSMFNKASSHLVLVVSNPESAASSPQEMQPDVADSPAVAMA